MPARGSKKEGGRGRRNERMEAERQGQHGATYPDNIRETRLVAGDSVAGKVLSMWERNSIQCEPCSIQDAAPSCHEGHSQSTAHLT